MATDLSRADPRTTQQDRVTRNRDSMFRRTNTEAASRRNFTDLRSASRGDGGADELRRALGMVSNAAGDFQTYATNKDTIRKEQDTAQGGLDAEAGLVDQQRQEKSRAYRDGVLLSRKQKQWAEGSVQLDQGLQELVQNQTDPDPQVRLAEISSRLDEHFKGLAVNPDTNEIEDMGSPATKRWLAEQMKNTRANVLAKASERIEKRMGEESLNNTADAWRATLAAGGDLDWTNVFNGLLPSVDKKEALGTLLNTVKSTAAQIEETDPTRAAQIIDGLLGFEKQQRQAVGPAPLTPTAAPASTPGQLVAPFAGFGQHITSRMGEGRQGGSAHNGEDFAVPIGTDIVAPMGGTVVGSHRNARGGNQVIIEMDNGVRLGFAHLSSRGVQQGQRVEAGALLGKSGNTGKSSGPHVHMTATVGGKKVSPSEYFSSKPQAASKAPVGAPVDPSVIDPPSPSELADQAGPAQLTPPSGALTLSPEQRLDMQEFRRGLRNRIDARADRERNEAQGVEYSGFVGRLAGAGNYPTVSEAHEAMRSGRISPQMFATIANTIDSDARQDRAEARSIATEGREAARENKVSTVDSISNSIMGRVYRGDLTLTEATGELNKSAIGIGDREVRQAVVNGVRAELEDARALRLKGPEYSRADSDFKRWGQTYASALSGRVLGRRVKPEQATKEIQSWVDEWMVPLGRGDIKPEGVDAYMRRAEQWLDRRFDERFPRRATTKP